MDRGTMTRDGPWEAVLPGWHQMGSYWACLPRPLGFTWPGLGGSHRTAVPLSLHRRPLLYLQTPSTAAGCISAGSPCPRAGGGTPGFLEGLGQDQAPVALRLICSLTHSFFSGLSPFFHTSSIF